MIGVKAPFHGPATAATLKNPRKTGVFEGFLFTSMCCFRMIEIDQARNVPMRFA
jgi:hypothetical protein